MTTHTPLISIIIPVRNEGTRIREAIRSFLGGRSHLFPVEFVVVDDASGDGCCHALCDLVHPDRDLAEIKVIRLNSWSGIPYARNTGAAHAAASILFITDANVHAGAGWDIPLFREIRPDRALCATIADRSSDWKGYGCMLDVPSMGIRWLRDPGVFGKYIPVAPSTGTVISKELFQKLGGFDTAMPVYGAAEPEFCVRLWLYGAHITCLPDLILSHRFRPDEERRPFLDRISLVQICNYLRFGLLYLPSSGIQDMLDYWVYGYSSDLLSRAIEQLDEGRILQRRRYLESRLRYNFDWYRTRFSIVQA